MVPVVASNRIGTETFELKNIGSGSVTSEITFYGGSFICGPTGEVVKQIGVGDDEKEKNGGAGACPRKEEGFVVAEFDLDELQANRAG